MKVPYRGIIAVAALLITSTTWAASAEEVYKSSCALCHDAGIGGAPKLGDKAAWAPRIKQGKDALYKISLNGKPGTAMVAKGGNAKLSDAEVKSTVDYMMAKAK